MSGKPRDEQGARRDGDPERESVLEVVRRFAADARIECSPGLREGELVLVLPGEQKLKTVCSVLVGERDLCVSAFVIRHPDENHEALYRWLLQHNLRTPGLAYALDPRGDVFAVGRLPRSAVGLHTLDQLLGMVLQACDGAFNELLALGFLTSMRREWHWRISRGESLRNLEAFRDILEHAEAPSRDIPEHAEAPSRDIPAESDTTPRGR